MSINKICIMAVMFKDWTSKEFKIDDKIEV